MVSQSTASKEPWCGDVVMLMLNSSLHTLPMRTPTDTTSLSE